MGKSAAPSDDTVSLETLARLTKEDQAEKGSSAPNIMQAIKTDLPRQLAEKVKQRDAKVAEVLALNTEIVTMQTTLQVGAANGDMKTPADAGTPTGGEAAAHETRTASEV